MIQHSVAAALLLAQANPPAERPCLTPQEAGDLAVAMMPYLVDAAARHCRPHLAADSFLALGAEAWSERLRRDAAPRRDSALRGLAKMGGAEAPAGVGGEAAFQFFAQMISVALSANIRPESCPQVDTIARALEPLPADNIAGLVGAGLTLAIAQGDAGDGDEPEVGAGGGAAGTDGAAAPGQRRDAPPICPA